MPLRSICFQVCQDLFEIGAGDRVFHPAGGTILVFVTVREHATNAATSMSVPGRITAPGFLMPREDAGGQIACTSRRRVPGAFNQSVRSRGAFAPGRGLLFAVSATKKL